MVDDGGIGRLQRRLAAIPQAVQQAALPAVLSEAEAMAATMRALVPKDTGALAESIAVTPGGQTTPPYSQPGGMMTVPANAVAVTVGNEDVRYGHLVEYGHANGVRGSVVPAHPYFWPAVRLHQKKATRAIKRSIGKAVRTAWTKP